MSVHHLFFHIGSTNIPWFVIKANIILAEKFGKYECNQDERYFALDEQTLIEDIKHRYYQWNNNEEISTLEGDNGNEQNDGAQQLNGNEVQKPSQTVNDDTNLNDPYILSSWEYAKENIIPYGYKHSISYNKTTKKYHSLKPMAPSFYCRGLKSYNNLMDNTSNIQIGVLWAFTLIGICIIFGIMFFMKKKEKNQKIDPKALSAANLVLEKLSEQQAFYFSINQQMRGYAVSRLNISDKTWEKTVKYVNDSDYVETIIEELHDGQIRDCWKWKAPVPFVPLSMEQ